MRHATYHVTEFSSTPVVAGRPSKRRGLFAALFAALHRSRRLQAERILRQHQHLIARAQERDHARAQEREAGELKSAIESVSHVGK
jgi:alpha-D-ribose 1-methylphosphonate 5-triphosphate synthase subunit PhnG